MAKTTNTAPAETPAPAPTAPQKSDAHRRTVEVTREGNVETTVMGDGTVIVNGLAQ